MKHSCCVQQVCGVARDDAHSEHPDGTIQSSRFTLASNNHSQHKAPNTEDAGNQHGEKCCIAGRSHPVQAVHMRTCCIAGAPPTGQLTAFRALGQAHAAVLSGAHAASSPAQVPQPGAAVALPCGALAALPGCMVAALLLPGTSRPAATRASRQAVAWAAMRARGEWATPPAAPTMDRAAHTASCAQALPAVEWAGAVSYY
jgi:hypothetical protein